MAALPVWTRATSALLSATTEPKASPNAPALTRSCTWVRVVSTAGSDQAPAWPAAIRLNTSDPPLRSRRYSSHIMFVHFEAPASAMGVVPCALKASTAASSSS